MVEELLPLIKERFHESEWNVICSHNAQSVYNGYGKMYGTKEVECIVIESNREFTNIRIGYDISKDEVWIGGQDIPFGVYEIIYGIIKEWREQV